MDESKEYSCPICGISIAKHERYPRYVCRNCIIKTKDINGRKIGFYNTGLDGGFDAMYLDTGDWYNNHTCFIDGIECHADEARFGGIVIQKVIQVEDRSSELSVI